MKDVTQNSSQDKTPKSGKGGWRRIGRRAAYGLVALALLLAGVWVFRIPIVESLAGRIGAKFGVPGLAFEIERLDPRGARARDIWLGEGDGDSIDWAEAGFSVGGLISGRLDSLTVSGLKIGGAVENGRLMLPGLGFLSGARRGTGPREFFIERMRVENISLNLDTAWRPIAVTGTLDLEASDATLEVALNIAAARDLDLSAEASGTVEFDLSGGLVADLEFKVAGTVGRETVAADGTFRGPLGAGGELDLAATVTGEHGVFELKTGGIIAALADDATLPEGGWPVDLGVAAGRFAFATLSVEGLNGRISGQFTRTDGALGLTLKPGTVIDAARLRISGVGEAALTGKLSPGQDGEQRIEYLTGSGVLRLALETGRFAIRLTEAGRSATYLGAGEALILDISEGGGALHVVDALISAPHLELAATGTDARFEWRSRSRPTGRITAVRLRHTKVPAYFTPLKADLVVRPGAEGEYTLNARLTDLPTGHSTDNGGGLELDIVARHNSKTGRGQVTASLAPIELTSARELGRLFPILAGLLDRAEGRLDLKAEASWGGRGLQSSADLLVDLSHAETGEWRADNLIGVVHFDSLFPFATPPGQEIRIGRLDIGVPATQGRIEAQLRRDGTIEVRLAGVDLFGGRVVSDAFVVDPRAPDFSVILHATGLKLDDILRSAEFGTIATTGELAGDIPLVVFDGEVAVTGGKLRAAPGGGVIAYRPGRGGDAAATANEAVNLLMRALENFHYDDFVMTIDEGAAEAMEVTLTLSGSNPDLYDGKPMVLNISVNGPLRELLDRGLETVTLPSEMLKDLGIFD